jgi:CRP-like cAMP-binding protein
LGESIIRVRFTAAEMNSSRVRTPEESRALHQFGSSIRVYQLQGNLAFATTEALVRHVMQNLDSISYLLLDMKRVLTLNESACRLLYQLLRKLSDLNKSVVFAHAQHLPLLRRYMKVKLEGRFGDLYHVFNDHDPALEWCENRLLASVLPGDRLEKTVSAREYELFKGLTNEEFAVLLPLLRRRSYQRSQVIVEAGDEARELFFLARGHVSVVVTLVSGASKRLAAFSAGMAFGEMAIIDRAPRSATIVADTDVECDLMDLDQFEQLGVSHPSIKIKLLENLNLGLCHKLRKVNRHISVFD